MFDLKAWLVRTPARRGRPQRNMTPPARIAMAVVCVLTCPPEVWAVSNTKAYQSPLDVPPPPRNLTTRIKAKLRPTHSKYSQPWHTQVCSMIG